MSLRTSLKRGDWVKATSETGAEIIGQATHDMGVFGYAALTIAISGDQGTEYQEIRINVNFWSVVPIMRNQLKEGPF